MYNLIFSTITVKHVTTLCNTFQQNYQELHLLGYMESPQVWTMKKFENSQLIVKRAHYRLTYYDRLYTFNLQVEQDVIQTQNWSDFNMYISCVPAMSIYDQYQYSQNFYNSLIYFAYTCCQVLEKKQKQNKN